MMKSPDRERSPKINNLFANLHQGYVKLAHMITGLPPKVPFRAPNAPGMKMDFENDWKTDGCFIGAEGKLYPSETDWRQIPPVRPNNGKEATHTAILINGIMTDVALHACDLQHLANTGCNVVGIHNATKGFVIDMIQGAGDKLNLDLANNGATQTATKVLERELKFRNPDLPKIVGHSQGALVVSNAISRVEKNLASSGYDDCEVDEMLAELDVMTLGGASWSFPAGPSYEHHINNLDLVPQLLGMGASAWLTAHPTDEIERFTFAQAPHSLPDPGDGLSTYLVRACDRSFHGLPDVYAPRLNQSPDQTQ
jgi:hypothetical protein